MPRNLDQLDLCGIWDLTHSTRPLYSRLYSLEPIGLGTPDTESLTSYFTRLAQAHSVSLRTLAFYELSPMLNRPYLSSSLGNGLCSLWKESARALNGTGVLAQDWVETLEHLTLRTDLRFLTLLSWSNVLTQQGLLKSSRVWCPECFKEWRETGKIIYEPLLWNLSAVSFCLHHKRTLVGKCPHPDCQAVQPLLRSRIQPGYCSKCYRWLGVSDPEIEPSTPAQTHRDLHWQLWIVKMVGELIAHNVDLNMSPHLENIPGLIAAYQVHTAESLNYLAKRLKLVWRTLRAWQTDGQTPQLEPLLRLCYCCGVSPYHLFTLQTEFLRSCELEIRSLPDFPASTKPRRRPFDAVGIQRYLESTLASNEYPAPSMRTVAKRLKYSPRELRRHFPDLCRSISNRYKTYQSQQNRKEIEEKSQ